jgi:hypothetical protein
MMPFFATPANPLYGDPQGKTPIALQPMTWFIVAGVMFAAWWLLRRVKA